MTDSDDVLRLSEALRCRASDMKSKQQTIDDLTRAMNVVAVLDQDYVVLHCGWCEGNALDAPIHISRKEVLKAISETLIKYKRELEDMVYAANQYEGQFSLRNSASP